MNPLTNVRNVTKLSQRELEGLHGKTSWHDEYKESAWIFIGGLPYDLSEGDVITVFSQWGEIVNINMIRDKATGKFKGFGFICYENQKSTVLAVDNFNGIKILGRTIRVDHVKDYKPPKDSDKLDDITRQLYEQGCAPQLEDKSSKVIGGYTLVESGDEEDFRDDGFGTHSVLKGIPDRNPASARDQTGPTAVSADGDERNSRKDRTKEFQKMPSNSDPKKDRHRHIPDNKKKHNSKTSKRKELKSKKSNKKNSKRRKSSSSSSESDTDDSSSTTTTSSSSSDSTSSSESTSEEESKSKKRKHKTKK